VAQVLQYPLDDGQLLDAGDHPQLPTAPSSDLDVDGENPLEPLRLRLRDSCRSLPAASPHSLVWLAVAGRVLGTTRARSGLAGANTP
jgi:hypothetical protein